MKGYYYVGLDIHKKSIWYCVKRADGEIVAEGKTPATRADLGNWLQNLPRPWKGGMEATIFSGWIYDFLTGRGADLQVGHPQRMKAIVAAKKKSDKLDARTLADLLRSNLFPGCYMASSELRELRRILRYRQLLVREATRFKNKAAGLLMEVGAQYDKRRLNGTRYFNELLDSIEDVPATVLNLLRMNRSMQRAFESTQVQLLRQLGRHPKIRERMALLTSIPGVGEVTSLTWILEVGDSNRFPTVGHAISYCGLCSPYRESAGKVQRAPLSKQRNKYLQHSLIEAAKLAPRWNSQLAAAYDREKAKGADENEATLTLARKLVAYLRCVDMTGKPFEVRSAA